MNSPNKLSRKPQQFTKPIQRLNRLRCRSDEIAQICYISPKKKQKNELNIGSIIQSAADIKTMKIVQQNQQLKLIIDQLKIDNSMMKEEIHRLRTKQQKKLLETFQKEGLLQFSKDEATISDTQEKIKQTSNLKNLNFSFKKDKNQNQQCQQQINAIKIQSLSKALKEANRTIAKLKIQLSSAYINRQIAQHRLAVKQKMISNIKQRQCQKIFKQVSQNNSDVNQNYFCRSWGSRISNILTQTLTKQNEYGQKLKKFSSSNFNDSSYKPFSFIQRKSDISSTMSDLKSIINK